MLTSINPTNNRTNFGTLYQVDKIYTPQQEKLAKIIIAAFKKKPRIMKSIEDRYGRRGIDFTIKPENPDSIVLTGHLDGLKKDAEEGYMNYNREKSVYIGTYNEKNPFEPKDVHRRIKEENLGLYRYIIPLTLTIGLSVFSIIAKKFLPKTDAVKPLIENVNRAAETLPTDSTKVLKNFPLKK